MAPYQSFKLFLVETLGIAKDGFHIILGFLVFLLFARLFSLKLSSWKALIAPMTFAILLEIIDLRDAISYSYPIDWLDAAHDILLTSLLPIVLVIYCRYIQKA